MFLPNDVARCADALDNNCQFRKNCKRWAYRTPKPGDERRIVWENFASKLHLDTGWHCYAQMRID